MTETKCQNCGTIDPVEVFNDCCTWCSMGNGYYVVYPEDEA